LALDQCSDVFGQAGANPAARVNDTNTFYGGNKPYGSTKILFVNGSIDPWHSLSVYADFSRTVKAILIQGTAHCADSSPPYPKAPATLAQAQAQINQQISVWLAEGNN
jgi:thymus-specific serine protease